MSKHIRYRATAGGRARQLFNDASRRAKAKGLTFNITIEDVQSILDRGYCEITRIPFVLGSNSPYSPSLERKDSNLGYTRDNVVVVVLIYNVCKNKWRHEDVLDFAAKLLGASGPTQSSQNQTTSLALDPKSVWRV